MIPYRSQRPMAVPKNLETRIEIMRAVHKLMAELATDSGVQKFDPDQPRVPAGNPDGGQWTSEGVQPAGRGAATLVARRISPAREAECEAQHARDIFQCKMVGLPACYEQAALRYANCLVWRFRSPHHSFGALAMRTSEPKPHWINKLLVSFDSEVRKRGCRTMMRTSESGH